MAIAVAVCSKMFPLALVLEIAVIVPPEAPRSSLLICPSSFSGGRGGCTS